jgi:hypothetical protein
MKLTWSIVYCYHLLLWSGYSIVGWLSKKDSVLAKSILLIMFFYLSYLIAFTLLKTRKGAIVISFLTLLFYMLGKQVFIFVFS